MASTHPYNLWPLHVKLFTPLAMKAWGDAASSTPPLPAGLTVQIELEGVDGKQSKVWLLLGISEQVDVHQLADLEVLGCNVFDDLGKVFGHIPTFGDQLCTFKS